MKKILFLLLSAILLFSLMGCAVTHANSGPPVASDEGRGIIFEKHDKVKIVNEILDIEFNDNSSAKVKATYNMKNITDESLAVNNIFLYPLEDDIPKEIKVMRNGEELDYDVEYFGNQITDIDFDDDWETILSENDYDSQPLGDGSGFIEYTLYEIAEGFSFIPEDFYFTENLYLNAQGDNKLTFASNESQCKIITRQTLELDEYEYSTVEIDNIYEYLQDYYNSKDYYDLLATTLYKAALYSVDKNKRAIEAFEYKYFNSIDNPSFDGGINFNTVSSQPFENGSGFVEYTLNDIDEYFSFVPNDYYITRDFHYQRAEGYDLLFPNANQGKIITRQSLDLDGYDYTAVEIDNIYDYLEECCNEYHRKAILYNIEKNQKELQLLYFNNLTENNLYYDRYLVGAILYNVVFEPNEELELVVQYDYKLGSDFYNSSQTFRYYLTPAKYWQDFGGIEINLHLSKEYPKLISSSLEFNKIDKLTYQYVSDELPDKELVITTSYPWFKRIINNPFIFILLIFAVVILIVIVVVIIIVAVIIKKNKKKGLLFNQEIPKKFQLFPFLVIAGYLLLTFVKMFRYRLGIGNWLGTLFINGNYVNIFFLPICAILFIGILTNKRGNFLRGTVSVLAILSAICFVIIGFIFPSGFSIIEEYFNILPIRNIEILGICFHFLIAIFLIAFASLLLKAPQKIFSARFFALTILTVISILLLSRMDLVLMPIILKTDAFQSANTSYTTILQQIGERYFGEKYLLPLDYVDSIFRASLPYAFYSYLYPRYKRADICNKEAKL